MNMLRWSRHALVAIALTVLTQVGGAIYLLAMYVRKRWPLLPARPRLALAALFVGIYAAAWLPVQALASLTGRVGLPCSGSDNLRVASPLYCVAHRHYVRRDMRALARALAHAIDGRYPGTVTQTLDANFAFFDGFPLAPHLSHDDGNKLDIAFYYAREGEYAPAVLRSPIGYWAFEDPSDDERQPCRGRFSALRWEQAWFQIFTRDDLSLEDGRTRTALIWLQRDGRARRAFLEPHLVDRLRLDPSFVRFQGCNAARHDDHFHIELR